MSSFISWLFQSPSGFFGLICTLQFGTVVLLRVGRLAAGSSHFFPDRFFPGLSVRSRRRRKVHFENWCCGIL